MVVQFIAFDLDTDYYKVDVYDQNNNLIISYEFPKALDLNWAVQYIINENAGINTITSYTVTDNRTP